MKFDKLLDDRQSQSQAAVTPRRRRVRLLKAIEDKGKEFRRNALSRIADPDFDVGDAAFEEHGNSSIFWSEFDRVVQEIPKDLLEALGVA